MEFNGTKSNKNKCQQELVWSSDEIDSWQMSIESVWSSDEIESWKISVLIILWLCLHISQAILKTKGKSVEHKLPQMNYQV